MPRDLFPGFQRVDVDVGDVVLHAVTAGSGPPLLLLHGYPQTHAMWHRVAPALIARFTVVAPDLRGYGASSKPASVEDHASYSKRAMAADVRSLMRHLGHERFAVCAHDRGARVAHRLGMDHPAAIDRLMLLDIAPTREMYANVSDAFARAYWHWFFLIRPAPHPELAILADTDRWFRGHFRYAPSDGDTDIAPFDPDAFAAYLTAMRDPDAVRASCEDYRAAATIDIAHDDADNERRLGMPLRVLWGRDGVIGRCFDPLALWRLRAEHVDGHALPGGHYLAEEVPDLLLAEMHAFFSPDDPES